MSSESDILSRLVKKEGADSSSGDPWDSLAATGPAHEASEEGDGDTKLNGLLQRIQDLTGAGMLPETIRYQGVKQVGARDAEFIPREPQSLQEVGLSESEVESLILKLMLSRGDLVGRDIADHIRLPFVLIDEILRQCKHDQLVVYRSSAAMNDYLYQLTDLGRERARRQAEHCSYFGAAPVTLTSYIEAVKAQSLENQYPTEEDLCRAFEDLLINPKMLKRLGARHQLGPRSVPVRRSRKRQDEYRGTRYRRLWPGDLDPASHRSGWGNHAVVRPHES